MENKIEKLKKAETEFISWLDNVNYSQCDNSQHKPCIHYRLIEGIKNGTKYCIAFYLISEKREPKISSRSIYPRAPQDYTIESFYRWMKEESKRKRLTFQAP